MFLPKIIVLTILCVVKVHSITSDWDLLWYKPNSTESQSYRAKTEASEDIQNATKIQVNQQIAVLRILDLSFAPNLQTLVLDNIGLTDIEPGTFKSLPPIKNFTIVRNSIKIIREGVFNNLTVHFLNLSYNNIHTIQPTAFDDMPELITVILDHNELTTYSPEFHNCPKLATISAKYNFIETLPEGIFKEIKENKLTIDFSYNKIKTVFKNSFDVKEFRDVYLDHNDLTDAKLLIKLVKADKVDLSDNHIDCLPKEFMENGLSKIKVLNVTSNPLNCSCLNDLKKKVKKNIEFQKMSPLVKNIQILLPEKDCEKKN